MISLLKQVYYSGVQMGCSCCLAADTTVTINGSNVSQQINSISVDSSQEILWETDTNKECAPTGDYLYMFGPGKTTVQITAYPFAGADDYRMGFECPVNVNISVPWKWVYDCRFCEDCFSMGGTVSRRKGKWRSIPMRKKQVSVTGDISSASALFEASGCELKVPKFNIQAGPQPVVLPQFSSQYSRLKYLGKPLAFDTDNLDPAYILSVVMGTGCPGLSNLSATLTNFTFAFQPPQPPTVSYTFESMLSVCPTCSNNR
jgi:hypothetical protein